MIKLIYHNRFLHDILEVPVAHTLFSTDRFSYIKLSASIYI